MRTKLSWGAASPPFSPGEKVSEGRMRGKETWQIQVHQVAAILHLQSSILGFYLYYNSESSRNLGKDFCANAKRLFFYPPSSIFPALWLRRQPR